MLAYRLTDRFCALTTHVSEDARAAMVARGAVPATRIAVVPNGIDIARFRPDAQARHRLRAALGIAPGTRVVLNVGRLAAEKAQHRLIDAFAQARTGFASHLLIAGEGSLRASLAAQIRTLGLGDNVALLGARDDVPALMNAADLFVLSSEFEGLPLVVGEALACGLPVIATDVAGVRALLGDDGRIVPIGDTAALANALRAALETPPGNGDHRRNLLPPGFALPEVAARWLALYRDATGAVHA
jgi:glycosyltransferase involved in cell wall biosynthesis